MTNARMHQLNREAAMDRDFNDGHGDSALGSEKDLLESTNDRRASATSTSLRNLQTARAGLQSAKGAYRPSSKLSTGNRMEGFRPSTSTRGAGYTAKSSAASSGRGSPATRLSSATPTTVPPLQPTEDDELSVKSSASNTAKLEKKLRMLLDSAIVLASRNNITESLAKIKEAEKLRRTMGDARTWSARPGGPSQTLTPLSFKMSWYHAEILASASKYDEAVKILKDTLPKANKEQQRFLRIRMALVHLRRGAWETALNILNGLLDDLPGEVSPEKVEVWHHVASCHAAAGRWETAYKYCQMIVQDTESPKAAFNSLVCLSAMKAGQKRVESAFLKLLSAKPAAMVSGFEGFITDLKQALTSEDQIGAADDALQSWEKQQLAECEKYVLDAARMVVSFFDDKIKGYDWCIDKVKEIGWTDWTAALEIAKATEFLRMNEPNKTIEILTGHDSIEEDARLRLQSYNMLTFLHFHMENTEEAREFAEKAYSADPRDINACINLGCIEHQNGNFNVALERFNEALDIERDNFHANYYQALALRSLGNHSTALNNLLKLNNTYRNRANLIYQISQTYEAMDDLLEAFNWLQQVYAIHANEPYVLQHLGELAELLGDKGAALWYFNESFRIHPSNFAVLNWLGRFFVASQFPEKAIKYFELAANLDPTVPKWGLLAAGAMRRAGHLTDAHERYLAVHEKFPDDADCLKLLIRICQETRAPASEIQKYQKELDLLSKPRPSDRLSTGRLSTARRSIASAFSDFGNPESVILRTAASRLSTASNGKSMRGFVDVDADDLRDFATPPGHRPMTTKSRASLISQQEIADDNLDGILPVMQR